MRFYLYFFSIKLRFCDVHDYPETGTPMPENILQTRCMVSGCTGLGADTDTREPGTREEGKGSVCTVLKMVRLNWVTGKTEFSMFQALGTPFQDLPSPLATPKFSTLSR